MKTAAVGYINQADLRGITDEQLFADHMQGIIKAVSDVLQIFLKDERVQIDLNYINVRDTAANPFMETGYVWVRGWRKVDP